MASAENTIVDGLSDNSANDVNKVNDWYLFRGSSNHNFNLNAIAK